MRKRLLLLGLLALAPAAARAQHQVYDPEPPRGSAYLRFFNGMPGALELRPGFAPALRLGAGTADRVTAYQVVENVANRTLAIEAQAGDRRARAEVAAPADGFVTVLVHPGPDGAPRIAAIREEMNFNRARVRLGAYNAASGCPEAGVRLEPGGPMVFDAIPAGDGRQRTVNAATAQLRVVCGARSSAPFPLEGLETGASFSIWAVGRPDGQVQGFMTRDATTPWRR